MNGREKQGFYGRLCVHWRRSRRYQEPRLRDVFCYVDSRRRRHVVPANTVLPPDLPWGWRVLPAVVIYCWYAARRAEVQDVESREQMKGEMKWLLEDMFAHLKAPGVERGLTYLRLRKYYS